jgi:PAS domain S-box-containing protein
MVSIWNKFVEKGVEKGMDFHQSKRIRITNQISIVISFIASLYGFIFYFTGFKKEGLEVIIIVAALFLPVILNQYKQYFLARIWFLITVNLAVFVYSYIFGRDTGIQLVFFPLGCLPWILYEIKDWKYIAAGTLIPTILYCIYDFSSGVPAVAITASIQHFIHHSIIITVFLIISIMMLFFAYNNNKSEQFLLDTYKNFFEDIPTPMWIFDEATFRFLAVNETAIKKYGYTREEMLQMKVFDMRPKEDAELVLDLVKARSGEEYYDAGYVRHKKKNGEVFFAHILSHYTKYNDRKARLVLAIDVNEKVLTEKKNEDLNQTLKKANEILQGNKEELESQQEELRQINDELTQQTEELKASEEELKTQEEELRQTNAEMEEKTELVERASRALAQKAEELEVSSKYKSEFLANMSHELRTPLNSVLILAKMLQENKLNNLNEKQVQYAKIIHKSGNDLLSLINDILDLSKIEAGKIDILFEEVKIAEIAEDMEQLFTVLANEKKITFSIVFQNHIARTIITDRQRIGQVIKNLLSNAFKFTHEGGEVTLAFTMEHDRLSIAVADSGIGIPPDKQLLIFEAFQQADGSTSRKFGGTGLGLSISKELIKRLHGEIQVSSVVNEGSIFTLLLPLQTSGATDGKNSSGGGTVQQDIVYDPTKVKEQQLIADDRDKTESGGQFILIIEDDPVFANHVKDFAHEKGYKTIIAISGDEGLFYAKKYKPSAIILDLGLPVIDGRNILRILKADAALKDIPVHIVTADNNAGIPVGDIENYFQKPLRDNDLEQAFSEIESYIKEKYKNLLLVLPGEPATRNMFAHLFSEKKTGVVFEIVNTYENAMKILHQKSFDCIIADIGTNIKDGIARLHDFKNIAHTQAYIITCLEGDISTHDEKELKLCSDSIIRKSTHLTNRLLDEVALFLHKIKNKQNVAVPQQYSDKGLDKSLVGKKVLLADDDMRNIFSVTALLEEHGMEVITAEHGREAIELLSQNSDVDIILMDIMMPEMDGYEAMQHIRAEKRYKKIPIIALTAKAMSGDREKCLEAGASDYITKPIDGSKLFSLMSVWLSQ